MDRSRRTWRGGGCICSGPRHLVLFVARGDAKACGRGSLARRRDEPMIAAKDVRAQVVDITQLPATNPAQVVVDANVLYFGYYSNFANLDAAGGRMPQTYQRREYPLAVARLRSQGTDL